MCDRTDHRTRTGLVESHGSVLVIKKAALLKCDGKRKQKHSAEASQDGEVGENETDGKGSNRFSRSQSNRLLHREKEQQVHEKSRETRLVARLLANSVNPMSGGTDSQISATPSLLQRWQFKGSNCAKARQVQGEKSSNEAKPQEKQWVAFSNVRKSCDSENEKEKKM